jgi:GAF domain-containing protein
MRRRSRASSKLANALSRKAKTLKAARHRGPTDTLQKQLNQQTHELEEAQRHLSEALEQQAATSEILRVIRSSPRNVQPVFDAVAESAARLCESLDCSVWRREGDRLLLVAHHGPIPQIMDWPIERGWVTGRAVVDCAPVHVHDLHASAQEFPVGSEMALRMGHRTILVAPLLRQNEAIGAIAIRRMEVKPFTEKQVELVTAFADQAVIAIENVRLFEAEQQRSRELTESLQLQIATANVLKIISRSAFDLRTVLQTLVESRPPGSAKPTRAQLSARKMGFSTTRRPTAIPASF